MLTTISRTWWLAALRGVLAIAFGVAALAWPGLTFEVLVVVFGAYAFVDGVVVLSFGLMAAGQHGRWWPLVTGGIFVIGAWAIVTGALALVFLFGYYAILAGVSQIALGLRFRRLEEVLQPRSQSVAL